MNHQEGFSLNQVGNANVNWTPGKYLDKPGTFLRQSPECQGIMVLDQDFNLIPKPYYYCNNNVLVSTNSYLVIENLGIRRVFQQRSDIRKPGRINGIQLYSGDECIELYGPDNTIEVWFKYLKHYCIQHDFKMQYDMRNLVGKGTQAKVYKAMEKKTGIMFAVKIFKKEKIINELESQLAILKEISVLRNLNHRNVMFLNEVFEDYKYVFLIMDYLEGKPLLVELRTYFGQQDEQLIQQVMETLLEAISYIHSKGILHRDLKLENIILRRHKDISDIVIADFGLADFYDPQQNYLFSSCGSIGYVAPEILNNLAYDYKVDIFSAGVILYILLIGELPFEGDTPDQVLNNNTKCQVNFNKLKYCSPSAVALVELLMKPDPKQRPSAQQALEHVWFKENAINQERPIGTNIEKLPQFKPQTNRLRSNSPLWNQSSGGSDSPDSPIEDYTMFNRDQLYCLEDSINLNESSEQPQISRLQQFTRSIRKGSN